VRQSLLFSDVRIEEHSTITDAVVLPHVVIGPNCVVRRAILDEGCEIPEGMQIGVDLALDARRFHVTEGGVVLVTADMLKETES